MCPLIWCKPCDTSRTDARPLRPSGVFSRQDVPKYLDVHDDSDWAGDAERMRSTTGVSRRTSGGHPPHAATVIQSLVVLSGTEVEFYAIAEAQEDCRRATS